MKRTSDCLKWMGVLTLTVVLQESGVFAAAGKPAESGELGNIVIEGIPHIQMKGDKPTYQPNLDPQKPLEEFLSNQMASANPIEKLSVSFPIFLPAVVNSDMVLSPWRGHLVFPPVLDLEIRRPANFAVEQWRLIITDDRGKIIRTIKGKGKLPDRVTWDGYTKSGEALQVGHAYAYSFSTIDRSGVPTYLFGKTVKISGFVDQQVSKIAINLDPDIVFTKGASFTPQGNVYLREIQDLLRTQAQDLLHKTAEWRIRVYVYGNEVELAQLEADMVRKYLEEAWHVKEGKIAAKGVSSGSGSYSRVEIMAVK